ncbi:MAG: hypothetical protein LBI96_05185 [Odoribacteraceae bacterium]|nr:hypothetical protein [Odoribacteraceae bacterium]
MKKVREFAGKLALVAVACLALACCQKDKLTVDKTELSLSATGVPGVFNVTCNGEWHAEAEGLEWYIGANAAAVRDFVVSPAGGDGNASVTVTLGEEATGVYAVDLHIVAKNKRVTIKLKAAVEENGE